MRDFFKLINPLAIESVPYLVAYRQELRICGAKQCAETARVIDHRNGAIYCEDHFKQIDSEILAPTESNSVNLDDLANTVTQIDSNVLECTDVFYPYPLSANPVETYEELDLLFTSWHQFNSF